MALTKATLLGLLATTVLGQAPEITPFGPNSARIRWASPGFTLADELPLTPFLDVPLNRSSGLYGVAAPTKSSATAALVNGNIAVSVTNGLIAVQRLSDGAVILQQRSLAYTAAAVSGIPPSAQAVFDGPASTETIVGFGEQGLAGSVTAQLPFTRVFADTEYYPYNSGRQAFMPLFMSSAGYAIMFAIPSYGFMSLNVGSRGLVFNSSSTRVFDMWISTTSGNVTYNATAPHPMLQLLAQYADAVGYAPVMPSFATGFIASKDRYHNQSQFLAVAHGYIDRGIPISMLTVDWFHWRALGDMSLNPDCWPDPAGMVAELQGLGIETMITHWPFMSPSSVHRAEYEAEGLLALNRTSGTADLFWEYLQNGSLILPYTQAARNTTFGHWWSGYGQYGVRAVWLDETEPDRAGYTYGEWMYGNYSDLEVGAAWKTQWIRTMTDGLAGAYGLGNYFLLSRSAWLGTAKHGHAMWSGDTSSNWQSMALQIPTLLTASLSGMGLCTHDIGGYSPDGSLPPLSPQLQELFVRWFQLGSVSPLMRLHGHRAGGPAPDPVCMQTNGDNEPWTLVNTTENYNAIVASIAFRDQLRNYVADAQANYAATNAPIVSPVWLLFPADTTCGFTGTGTAPACADEFMFGQDYLARPVTQLGQRTTWVYLPLLPAGQHWVYHFNGTDFGAGGFNVTGLACEINEFPLFYRERFPAVVGSSRSAAGN